MTLQFQSCLAHPVVAFALLSLVFSPVAYICAQETQPEQPSAPITKGQRVFTCGHSFHVFVPPLLAEICESAGIKDHVQVGMSSIGGSRIIQHWDVPDAQNTAKEALKTGKIDVLTLSPIYLPDPGLDDFVNLAFQYNKDIRILIQPIWLRWDTYEPPTMKHPETIDRDAITIDELRKRHEPLFKSIDDYVRDTNKRLGKTVLYVVPAPQAIIALREKIVAGQSPIYPQSVLFDDAVGHGRAPIKALVSYCNYAVMYRKSPVGLPSLGLIKSVNYGDREAKLTRMLQELAWEAVTHDPLSGVVAEKKR